MIFHKYYKNELIPYYWVPKWSGDVVNPSARVLNAYNDDDNKYELEKMENENIELEGNLEKIELEQQ